KPWPHRPPAEPRAPNKQGLNMFAWNMKYPPARSFWGINGAATDGPMALPGRYQVRLTVGGRSATQSFALKLDPRSKVTPADLAAQFAFLKQLRDTVNAVTNAIITIRNVRAQLTDAAAGATDAAKAFIRKLDAIEDGLYQVHGQADEDGLVYPPGPTERLSSLIFAASTMDARPTAPMYDVFRLFAPQIQKQLIALADALKRDLPAVNAALKSAGSRLQPRLLHARLNYGSHQRGPGAEESRVNSRLGPVSELTPLQRQGRVAASAAAPTRTAELRLPSPGTGR